MTFDLGMWPLTSLTYEGSHIASMAQVWLELVFVWKRNGQVKKCIPNQFDICSQFYNLTSDDLWPWYLTSDLINIWRFPYCSYGPSLVGIGVCMKKKWTFEKVYTKCLTHTHTDTPRYTPTRITRKSGRGRFNTGQPCVKMRLCRHANRGHIYPQFACRKWKLTHTHLCNCFRHHKAGEKWEPSKLSTLIPPL